MALSALPPGTDDDTILILKTRIRRDRQLILDLEWSGEHKDGFRTNSDTSRTMNASKISQHATFGHLHIHVTPLVDGTSMWKWAITKVNGGILQKEGFSESRGKATQDAAESLNATNLKWSEIHL